MNFTRRKVIGAAGAAAVTAALPGRRAFAQGSGPVTQGRDVDAEVRLAEVDERLAQELAGLGPFGQENPSPLLVTRNVRVTAARRVGDGSHLKLTLEDDRSTTRTAIGFQMGDREVRKGQQLRRAPKRLRGRAEMLHHLHKRCHDLTVRVRTIGDIISTGLVESPADSVDDIIAEIAAARVTERGSRADDRTSEAAMEDRKKEGYF